MARGERLGIIIRELKGMTKPIIGTLVIIGGGIVPSFQLITEHIGSPLIIATITLTCLIAILSLLVGGCGCEQRLLLV